MTSIGLGAAGHPLLATTTSLPETDGFLLTGRLSLATHPWLAEHAVLNQILLPGTAFVEMAVRAGDEAGCGTLDELTLHAPLTIPPTDAIHLQVTANGPDPDGRRTLSIHSRIDDSTTEQPWTRNAIGTISNTTTTHTPQFPTTWPPPGATPIDITTFYDSLSPQPEDHDGPTFQGLTAAWRLNDDILTEVELPTNTTNANTNTYTIHPALFDAAVQGIALTTNTNNTARLPFAWNNVTIPATRRTHLRIHITPNGTNNYTLTATDPTNNPVLSAQSQHYAPSPPTNSKTTTPTTPCGTSNGSTHRPSRTPPLPAGGAW